MTQKNITVYGIPNCGSVKKTRVWLDEHDLTYVFHDFKKMSLDAETIKYWLKTIPLDVLINKKGTTWRNLSPDEQAKSSNQDSAIELMMTHTSVIKRPVVITTSATFVGHDEKLLQSLL